MSENVELAIQLLIIGMLSVFFILGIVTGMARLLILCVNKWAPDTNSSSSKVISSANLREIAVITAAVEVATGGKGLIKSIKKLN